MTFDELLDSKSFKAISRGTGALARIGECWFVLLYHLSFPVPNNLAEDSCAKFHAYQQQHPEERQAGAAEEAERVAAELLADLALDGDGNTGGGGGKKTQKKKKGRK